MGITEDKFKIVWEAISWWLREKGWSPAELSFYTGFPRYRIEKGIATGSEWISSDFLHCCVEVFGLRPSRLRGIEDTIDTLTDEECIEVLTAALTPSLKEIPKQGKFWA